MAEFMILVLLIVFACKCLAWFIGPARLRVSPQEFMALVEHLPPSSIVVQNHNVWSSMHIYKYRDAAHIITTDSPVELHFPSSIVRVASPQSWVPGR